MALAWSFSVFRMSAWTLSKIQGFQEEIRQLKPWTVSWSNVPDYVDTAAFHRMARQLSGAEDTVHYAHR
eukprot:gene29351-12437_t